MFWHTKTVDGVLKSFGADIQNGLFSKEAKERLERNGENALPEQKRKSLFFVFIDQFRSPLAYILIIAGIIVFSLGEFIDGVILFAVILFNAVVGVIQEGKAEKTLVALKKYVETDATVVRDGREEVIEDKYLVEGDTIILREGDKIPADARIVECKNFAVEEAALTGESGSVQKENRTLENENLAPHDQTNMVFKGSYVVKGSARAIVVATGIRTVIGGITKRITEIDTEIPLKKDIAHLSRIVVFVVVVSLIALFGLGMILGKPVKEMFIMTVSLAVSVIPEGLPAVLTIVLARGVWRMVKQKALVKKLQAIEALGQANVIAVDKTGTITKNEMLVKSIFCGGKTFSVLGSGYEPKGSILLDGKEIDPLHYEDILFSGKLAAFGADAGAVFLEDSKTWKTFGDPTEVALFTFGRKVGFEKENLEKEFPLVEDIPFDHKVKYHAVSHGVSGKLFVSVTGAPEAITPLLKKIRKNGAEKDISEKDLNEIEARVFSMSSDGMRVLASAYTELPRGGKIENLSSLTFGALYGIEDSIRPEVRDSVKLMKDAGIKVVMITGDHKITAISIAKKAGIFEESDEVLTGNDLETMTKEELSRKLPRVSVFARVTPERKLNIVEAYRERGEVIAMTGDGVNDAPSLVAADLGVGMGRIGTEVAKEAADIVLLDDNLGTIVSAMEEGRNIYKTIKKVILYFFSTNLAELLVIAGALATGFPIPILPAQILWLNVVTDGFFGIALGMEPKEDGLLSKRFHRSKHITDWAMFRRIIIVAIPMVLGTLILFSFLYEADLKKALTVSLTTLAVFQWFNAWNVRSETRSLFLMNPFSNIPLVFATIASILLQVAAVYWGPLQTILRTVPLTLNDWGIIILISLSVILFDEVRKIFARKIEKERITLLGNS